jgi:hypothetical protein
MAIFELDFALSYLGWGVGFGGFFAKILRFVNCNQGADSHVAYPNSNRGKQQQKGVTFMQLSTVTSFLLPLQNIIDKHQVAVSKNTVY